VNFKTWFIIVLLWFPISALIFENCLTDFLDPNLVQSAFQFLLDGFALGFFQFLFLLDGDFNEVIFQHTITEHR